MNSIHPHFKSQLSWAKRGRKPANELLTASSTSLTTCPQRQLMGLTHSPTLSQFPRNDAPGTRGAEKETGADEE